ncbi:MAG: hypothetical protein HDS75_05355 [Bacteroidales bacterium]|nr:hypothetical protein [Bacteroidales bacterium]
MEEQVAKIPRLAEERALVVIEKKEILYKKEMQKLRKQHADTVSSLQSQYDALSKEYRSLDSTTATRIERLEREKNDLLTRLKAMLDYVA